MTSNPPRRELAGALASFLALPDAPELLDPPLRERAHELLAALEAAPPDGAAAARIGAILDIGRAAVRHRLPALRHEADTLAGLLRRNREVAQQLEESLGEEQRKGREACQSFSIARKLIARQGEALLARLDAGDIERLIAKNLGQILASPTTAALTQAMQSLADQAAALFENIQRQDRQIKLLVDAVYARFNEVPGIALAPPQLPDLDGYRRALRALDAKTREFCRRPINLMTDKNSLAKKFGLEVVSPLRGLFMQVRTETERWLQAISTPLQEQIQEKKVGLERREEDLGKIRDQIATLEARLEEVETALARLRRQEEAIDGILALLQAG